MDRHRDGARPPLAASGTVRPSALAVLRLMNNSKLLAAICLNEGAQPKARWEPAAYIRRTNSCFLAASPPGFLIPALGGERLPDIGL